VFPHELRRFFGFEAATKLPPTDTDVKDITQTNRQTVTATLSMPPTVTLTNAAQTAATPTTTETSVQMSAWDRLEKSVIHAAKQNANPQAGPYSRDVVENLVR